MKKAPWARYTGEVDKNSKIVGNGVMIVTKAPDDESELHRVEGITFYSDTAGISKLHT